MAYFNKDFIKFFKELAANNNKAWFDENRKRYITSVKEPHVAFVEDIANKIHKLDKTVETDPKKCIFRINRDIRFSKDKTPYKTYLGAVIAKGGKKGVDFPGYYLELGPEGFKIYGGLYVLDKTKLEKVRKHIAKDPKVLRKLLNAKAFKTGFGEIRGEKNKIVPKQFKEALEKEPLIANKQFYYFKKFPASKITDAKLDQIVLKEVKTLMPLNDYFRKAAR
ncbi:MAG: DUF2461 domain-containing protein [Bacteroidia bacterium]|nr:DUF2461 domain-containing protein [Bacteroidia bacterium]NNM15726.1 DUF2461 domain-containing protein [Bacteroidia bacterium]